MPQLESLSVAFHTVPLNVASLASAAQHGPLRKVHAPGCHLLLGVDELRKAAIHLQFVL